MIRVERGRVPRPSALDSPRVERERQLAAEFHRDGRHGQQRFDFTAYKAPEISRALTELFYGKCAYCEVKFAFAMPVATELFRPKTGVTERPEHPGYWWLASDWDNMLISCPDCNRVRTEAGERTGKGNRFPLVDERQRAFGPGEEHKERPLLLDPCRDFPEEHLVFDETGRVVSDTQQGQMTISVLGLNRIGLVESRREAGLGLKQTFSIIDGFLAGPSDEVPAVLADLIGELMDSIGPDQEFAGLKRQLARPTIDRLTRKGHLDSTPESASPTPTISKSRMASAKSSFHQHQVNQSSFSLADQKGRDTYRSERRMIQRVLIHNVKAIRDLELDLTDPGSGRTPWLMLLGENGTGKSTVLQAIALTLTGATGVAGLVESGAVRPADFVRSRCEERVGERPDNRVRRAASVDVPARPDGVHQSYRRADDRGWQFGASGSQGRRLGSADRAPRVRRNEAAAAFHGARAQHGRKPVLARQQPVRSVRAAGRRRALAHQP